MSIDLLRKEMDTLWGREAFGRHREHPLLAVAVAEDGEEVRFGQEVPTNFRQDFLRLGCRALESKELLEPLGAIRIEGGPSYVFPREVSALEAPAPLRVFTSDSEPPEPLPAALEPWWEADEWLDLIDGRLGPWAMAEVDGQIVSICHTPVAAEPAQSGLSAAEAGVWTHPDHRRHGWAAVVTSAWACVSQGRFETLFYSTSFDNRASQAVARKLGLRPIGEIRQVLRA